MWLRNCRLLSLLTLSASVALPSVAATEPLLIRNGTLLTETGGVLETTDLLVEDGRIAAIGAGLEAPTGAQVIDAVGRYVMPGIGETVAGGRRCTSRGDRPGDPRPESAVSP